MKPKDLLKFLEKGDRTMEVLKGPTSVTVRDDGALTFGQLSGAIQSLRSADMMIGGRFTESINELQHMAHMQAAQNMGDQMRNQMLYGQSTVPNYIVYDEASQAQPRSGVQMGGTTSSNADNPFRRMFQP